MNLKTAGSDPQLGDWESEGGFVGPPTNLPGGEASGLSLQERFGPRNACFGCGPSNAEGLHIRSFPDGRSCVASWRPESKYEAFPGILCGGVIATLLDCHSNWTAAWYLYQNSGSKSFPYTVTSEFTVKLFLPTSSARPVHLQAKVINSSERSATVAATLSARGEVTASFRGRFVAVEEGHPAFGRW